MDQLSRMEKALIFAGLASFAVGERYDKEWSESERNLAYELTKKVEAAGKEEIFKMVQATGMDREQVDVKHAQMLLELMNRVAGEL